MKISLVIPFIVENEQQNEILNCCYQLAAMNMALNDTELILISNGSTWHRRDETGIHINKENTGVLATFKQGYELATGDVICFIHSDVLLHEARWDERIATAFESDQKLGLAGLFGAKGIGDNGGRIESMSNMQGKEWGKCPCHPVAWMHHSAHMPGISPAAVFDGVGLFFRRETLKQVVEETDMFADWRAPHHFYDRIMSCKVADLGWHMATIGIEFDHWSGATANSSKIYNKTAMEWLVKHRYVGAIAAPAPDQAIYAAAEKQFFEEFGHRLPLLVNPDYSYRWAR